MVASILPDRENRHLLQFYVAPKMNYGMRLVAAGLLILAGFGVQLLVPAHSIAMLMIGSVPLLLAGNLLLVVRGYNLRPAHAMHSGTWEKTTRDRFAKMRQLEQEVKRWDESFTDLTCVSGVVALFMLAIGVGVTLLLLAKSPATRFWVPLLLVDATVLLLPHWLTGTRRGWRPLALRQIIDALETALAVTDQFDTPPCQTQPMFEMAGKDSRQVPINARVFIRFPDGPSGLLGLQFQVALNNVQGTNFPYLYAVIVADKEFGLLDNYLSAIEQPLRHRGKKKTGGLTVESSTEGEVEVIIIRQRTTKKSGYHTKPAAIRSIASAAWTSVEMIVK